MSTKLLSYDGKGFWLCQKRFSRGKLTWWPKTEQEAAAIRAVELLLMLQQGDPRVVHVPEDWRMLGLVEINHSPAMMVMEFGANGSLYGYLQSLTEMPWGLRLRMAEELARGLAYLHAEKIIHRDIKSLNVVLDKELHAKWCDFGLAALKLHTTTTTTQQTASPVGTLRWMAPELFAHKTASPSTASDVWALGMVFFELASRKLPFEDARDNDQVKDFIKEATGEEVPAECEQASPGFALIMRRCWSERTQRPTAADLARELSRLPPANQVSAPPVPRVLKSNNDAITPSYSRYS